MKKKKMKKLIHKLAVTLEVASLVNGTFVPSWDVACGFQDQIDRVLEKAGRPQKRDIMDK